MKLVDMEQLFEMINYWNHPHFATLDYKNWFYQIGLPANLRKLFSIATKSAAYQMAVWPQGFSWSPFVAQAIAWSIVLQEQDQHVQIIPSDTKSTPRWATVYIQSRVIGFVTIWYDNILVVAGEEHHRDRINEIIVRASARCKAIIKESTNSSGTVTYAGITFASQGSWQHAKRASWEPWDHSVSPNSKTLRELARILGILARDWYVAGEPSQSTFAYIQCAREVGKLSSSRNKWDEPARWEQDMLRHWETTRQLYESIRTEQRWRQRKLQMREQDQNALIWLASDANLTKGAWMNLKTGVHEQWRWSHSDMEITDEEQPREDQHHINALEILAALNGVYKVIQENLCNTTIVMAIDNTTACRAIKAGYYGWNPAINARLVEMTLTLSEKRMRIHPVWVPSEVQPADPLTRDKPIDGQRIERSIELMEKDLQLRDRLASEEAIKAWRNHLQT
jgi:hypothetical protein